MQEGVSKEKALVTVLSAAEWAALVRVCIAERDPICAETAITLMKRAWFSPPEESLNTVMQYYAAEGDVTNMQRFIEDVLPGPPTPIQRDLHIKAHLVSSPSHIPPTGALALLHSYETTATPAPIKSYTRLITALFSLSAPQTNSSLTNPNDATSISPSAARAQAWDLFTHMRYVAHPTPDLLLYTLMIRACAASHSSIHSQPERAQDLWTEMTIDKRIIPNEGAYAAVILTLARSGKREFVAEGFRLAREMVDGRGGAGNVGAMRPDRRIFCALLEGAKRIGDLARVRWILAEMVKGSGEQLDSEWQSGLGAGERAERAGIDEEVMMHVFHAYAAYKPPFKRAATKLVDSPESQMEHASEIVHEAQEVRNAGLVEEAGHPQTGPETLSAGSNPLLEDKSDIETDEEISSFSHIPPQTHADVIAEAQVLFARIISDSHSPPLSLDTLPSLHSTTPTSMLHRKFSHVRITPRLLNAYLSIHYAHTSIDASADLWRKVFSACGVEKNVRSYVEALERCAIARRGSGEREAARRWAEEVWKAWEGVEQAGWTKPGARMVERANIAMLRVYTLADDLDRAMSLLRAFVSRYPPSGTLSGSSSSTATRVKHPMLSTRTVLTGARPLVRITSAPEVADDGVPPLLTFSDIDTLHHRLVSKERVKDIKYLGWVCKAYVGALRRRRELTMKARVDLDDKNTGGMDDDGVE
ncbi:hypothetical protein BJ138DRAFT_1014830 [Hygrophoropsis aurantiaca]|uniref:Uncharacterized protein n=1 Tax=Hygrophoropsis aurantiaca TaxID=72124 RepID=A0ACB8A280_9AGAM|nr:hypothetical protein BJ138DRAFT_1014830 [Hygrophoropsis aurantiaca]